MKIFRHIILVSALALGLRAQVPTNVQKGGSAGVNNITADLNIGSGRTLAITGGTLNGSGTFDFSGGTVTLPGTFNIGSGTGLFYLTSGVSSTITTIPGTITWNGVTVGAAYGGTGVTSFGGTNTLLYTSSANVLGSIVTGNNGVVVTSAGGVPSISSTLPNAVQDNVTRLGTVTSGTWNASIIGSSYGGAGSVNGILKANGSGTTSAAAAGTDYAPPNAIYVDVYGAVGNGTTDDTTAITNAINAASANGVVIFTQGKTYKTTSQITVPTDGVILSGYGATITSATDSQFKKFKFSGRARGGVVGLRFNCLYTSAGTGLSAGVVEILNSNDIAVRDCEFNDVAKNGIYVFGTSARAKILNNKFSNYFCAIFSDDDTTNQPTALTITGNKFIAGIGSTSTAFSGAIKISGAGTVNSFAGHVISNNTINAAGQMGIELQTWVNGCTVSDNTITGTGFGISFSGISRCTAANNVIKNTTSFGMESASGCSEISFTGNTLDGTNTSGTRSTGIGISIVASTNTTVTGGSISGYGVGIYPQDSGGAVVGVQINGVTISGIGSAGNGEPIYIKTVSNFQVSNCNIAGDAQTYAYMTLDTSDGAVSYGIISNNRFTGSTTNNGITLYTPGTNPIQYVQFSGNDTSNASPGPGGMFNEQPNETYMKYIRCYGNTSDGTVGNFARAMNVDVWSLGSALTFPYRYFAIENSLCNADATSAAFNLQLIDATGMTGWTLSVEKIDSSSNAVTLTTTSAETINGSSTYALSKQYDFVTVRSDGSNWIVVNQGNSASTGTGAMVRTNGPTLIAPLLGTPASGNLSNCTALPTSSLTGTLQAAQEPAHTGDVTNSAGSLALALVNIPSATPAAGSILYTNSAAPSSPASGKVSVFADSTDLRFHDKNASGAIGTTVVADTGSSNNFLTAISAAGVISKAQPSISNISGLGTGVATFLGTPTSANLASALTDETGSGAAVFGTAPTISGGTITGLTSLGIRDTSAAFDVTLAATSSTTLTAGRTLTLDLTNAARTLKFTGSPTLADWFDQSVKTTASPTFAGGTFSGLILTAQNTRVSTDFSTSSATLANITGLTFTVSSGLTYHFHAELFVSPDGVGGEAFAMNGTATVTNLLFQTIVLDDNSKTILATTKTTSFGSGPSDQLSTSTFVTIDGTITVNAGGTLTVQFAQASASGTSTVKRGSTFRIEQIL